MIERLNGDATGGSPGLETHPIGFLDPTGLHGVESGVRGLA